MSDRNYKVIDCFPYFDEYGKEVLKLRVEMLKDYVDYFIITELNKTHSGIPINRKLKERIKEYNLPEDKIIVIELDVPTEDNLVVEKIDEYNCYEGNYANKNSVLARVRERMQKDALLSELYRFSEGDVFIVSDADEIIDPKIIDFYSKEVKNYPDHIIKFPLVHLEGRADLRVVHKVTGEPKWWDSLFMCTKKHLLSATPTQIRSNVNNPFILTNYYQDGNICKDLGWHFSWMGGADKRKIKASSFIHFDDTFSFLENSKYKNSSSILGSKPVVGNISPGGDMNYILKEYLVEDLPKEIFKFKDIENFMFDGNFEKSSSTIKLSDNFLLRNYDTDKNNLGYLDNFYDEFFLGIKDSPITMMEIGVSRGGSIHMWKDYLHEKSRIYAGDINYFTPIDNVFCIVSDMYDDTQVSKFENNYFDLIIDDGPHSYQSFVDLIQKYYSKVKEGGFIIVEDIINSSWVKPLYDLSYATGYTSCDIVDMTGKQKTNDLLELWKNGLFILKIKK